MASGVQRGYGCGMIDAASPANPLSAGAGRESDADVSVPRRSGVIQAGRETLHGREVFSRMDDDALVEAARRDREAFGALYDRYVEPIYAYIARRTGDAAQAEDIAATVWERALMSIERYEVRGVPFAAWLYRIAGNQIANHQRHERILRFIPLLPAHGAATRARDSEDEREVVRAALAALSTADREILSLCYFTGLTPPEIADVLACNVAAVHKRLHRARARMRRRLEEDSRVVVTH